MSIVFIETPDFVRKIDPLGLEEEMMLLQDELVKNPAKGKVVPGAGGARKVRMRVKHKGKSGGARVIYYFVDFRGEIWFLDIYEKSRRSDLAEVDKKRLLRFIKETIL